MKKNISISVEESLIDIIDDLSKVVGRSRSEIIEYCIRRTIRDLELWHQRMEKNKKELYDRVDRIIEEVIRKYWVEKHEHN